MKRLLATALFSWMFVLPALAIEPTKTPPVGTERGENSLFADQILDMARFKPGLCTVTTTGGSNANAGTCNGAAGIVTTNSISIAQNASSTVTITNNKILAGDAVLCTVDATSATAGSLPFCLAANVSASTAALMIGNSGSTTETANIIIYFLVISKGNTN